MSTSNTLRQIGFYAGMILIVLGLYILSVGPAMRLYSDSTMPILIQVMDVVYYPLHMAAESGVDGGFFHWYLRLWLPPRS